MSLDQIKSNMSIIVLTQKKTIKLTKGKGESIFSQGMALFWHQPKPYNKLYKIHSYVQN